MFYAGIDTHLMMHEVAVIDEKGERIWSGRIGNDRSGFLELLNKLKNMEESRGEWIAGIYMNPTGNYHMPISHFLRENASTRSDLFLPMFVAFLMEDVTIGFIS